MTVVANFTVQQLAEYLQVHENTIYEWLDQKTIFPNAFKIKKGWRIPRADVERAMRRDFEPPSTPETKAVPASTKHAPGFVNRWKA